MSLNYFDNNSTSLSSLFESAVWSQITATATVESGQKLIVYTAAGTLTLTLPAAPVIGDSIEFLDAGGTFSTNNLVINPNGKPILSVTENLIADVDNTHFVMIYVGSTVGWKVN